MGGILLNIMQEERNIDMSGEFTDIRNAYVLGKRRNGKGTRTYVGMKFTDDDGNEKLVIQPGVSISGTVVFKEAEEEKKSTEE